MLDLSQIQNWPPVGIGLLLGVAGWVLRRFLKGTVWRVLGALLIFAAIAIIISELIGFPLLWTMLAWLLGLFEALFTGIAFLCREGKEALQRL